MAKVYLGIDPGLSGALASLGPGSEGPQLWDAPVLAYSKSSGRTGHQIDEDGMTTMLQEILCLFHGCEFIAGIEWAQPMPRQGVTSVFTYGTGFGIWLGVLAALGIPRIKIRPQAWMKNIFAGYGVHDKKLSIKVAKELFPSADITLAKHHGRAEALLIAEYMRRINA